MSIRKQVRKVQVSVTEGEKRSFVLEYCVLEKEVYIEGNCERTYGIEVLKRENTSFGTMRIEYRKIFDIFCTEKEACDVINILADNTVTPTSIYDIIEQFIGADEIQCEEYEIIAV